MKESLTNPERGTKLRDFKDYTLVARELYRRLPGGVLARCIISKEAKKKLAEVYERTCCLKNPVPLHRRLQRIGYYWPEIRAQASEIQTAARVANMFSKKRKLMPPFPLPIGGPHFLSICWKTSYQKLPRKLIILSN